MTTILPHPPLRHATPVHGEPVRPRLLQPCRPQPESSITTSSPRRACSELAEACPELVEGGGPSGTHRARRTQHSRRPPHPLPETPAPPTTVASESQQKTTLLSPPPHPRRACPGRDPGQISPTTVPPQIRPKCTPRHLKSFLEKTLIAREGPNPAPWPARRITPPFASCSVTMPTHVPA